MKESYPINELKLNADFTTQEVIPRKLTEEELIELKDTLSVISINLATREQALRNFSNALKLSDQEGIVSILEQLKSVIYGDEGTKELKAMKENIIDQIRRGFKESSETVYGVAYYEEGQMHVYDSEGQYLYSRKLTNTESSNPKIFSLSKAQ